MAVDHWIDPNLRAENIRLLALLQQCQEFTVTIRVVGPWAPLDLPEVPGMSVESGNGSLSDAQGALEGAECVIASAWTFGCLAISRRIPTLIYGQHGYQDGRILTSPPWWDDPERYPFDPGAAQTPDDLRHMIWAAAVGDQALRVAAWRRDMIGAPWDPARFVAQFEEAVASW